MKNLSFYRRLCFALMGIRAAWRGEASFRLQCLATLTVFVFLVVTQATAIWWGVMSIMVANILAAELFNTALEHLVDHLHPEHHAKIQVVKDCAAGAVLILSFASLALFIAYLIAYLTGK